MLEKPCVTKSGSDLLVGSTVEFTKDGKLSAVIKGDDTKLEGTYKVEKEKLTVKLGILGGKPNGDSMAKAVESKQLTLPATFKRFEIDLSECSDKDLSRISNGFTFVLTADEQSMKNSKKTQFSFRSIYFE